MRKMVTMTPYLVMAAGAVAFFFAATSARAQEKPAGSAAVAEGAPPVPVNLQDKVNGVRKFTEDSVQIANTKFWLPSTLVVEQGDKVEIDLKNEVPGAANNQHGFAIPGYNIAKVVTAGTAEKAEFTADKVGIFPFGCQLHPAHVGGQLIVRPKS
jgi:nitrosocyanin